MQDHLALLTGPKDGGGGTEHLQHEKSNIGLHLWTGWRGTVWACLGSPVTVVRHVEGVLHFAACAADNGQKIDRAQYLARIDELRKMKKAKERSEIEKRLSLRSSSHHRAIEALRLLANAYKHDPRKQPTNKLIAHLGLHPTLAYAELSESDELQKGLARIVGLTGNAGYSAIAEGFVNHVEGFLYDVQTWTKLSIVKWGKVSFTDFAH